MLYAKPGCHLCEQAEAALERLRKRYPHTLELVDISADLELMHRYGDRIPVLVVHGREYAAPLSAEAIERSLAHATQETSTRG
jgi:hypothetical protein